MPKAQPTVASRDFRHAVALASRAIERGSTIPILSMVRCRANGAFEATGTDLDVTVTAKVNRGGSGDATFMLPGHAEVTRAIAAAGGASIGIEPGDGKLSLVSDALRVDLSHLLPVDDFPTGNEVQDEVFGVTLSHEQLRQLSRVAASISSEETRYYLNGVYLHHQEGSIYRAVATDGHRASVIELGLPDATGELAGIIIPRKTIRLLLAIAGPKPAASDAGIGLRVGSAARRNAVDSTAPERPGSTRAEFHFGAGGAHVGIASKLIDGTFPDYKRIIPHNPACSLLFDRLELRRAVLAVASARGKPRAVRLHCEPGRATLSALDIEASIGTSVAVRCDNTWKPTADLGINGGYLLSMIDAAGGDELLIRTDDPASPMLIRNPADPAWTGVLMPMRI